MTEEKDKNIINRPPVVVVLGHVDHGKSSILEAIRDFKITAKESGGITQHIGAYEIEHQGKKITFIDTPGHEAFSAMRSRGAKVADIAILVVAAEEGVKPQTKEAISHIQKSKIPLIVVLNKIDKPEADPERVRRELAKENILVEKMGGKIPCVELSAKTKQGVQELLDLILLLAEMEDLRADLSQKAEGVIIEAYLDNLRGPTATLILQSGVLRRGDVIATSSARGKVKSMEDFQGNAVSEAVPSMPVILIGFEEVPMVGEKFSLFPDIESAKKNMQERKISIPKMPEPEAKPEPDKKTFNLILKADVLGSIEAIGEVLTNLPQEKVALKILKAEVGQINESDIKLAKGFNARIVGFRVKTDKIASALAEREKIKIVAFDIIYELAQWVREAMERYVGSELIRVDLGKLKVLAIFRTEKNRQIVGGRVIEGEIKKGAKIEILREEEIIGRGKMVSLQKSKKETERVVKGDECGILYEGETRIEEGDILAFYTEERNR